MAKETGNRRALTCADCGFYDDIGRCSSSWAADCGELLEPDALACFDFVRKGAGERKKEKLALAIRDMQGVAAQSGKQAGMLADIKRVTSDLADQTAAAGAVLDGRAAADDGGDRAGDQRADGRD